ncbi:hypothetical protein DFJ74DRAFT_654528 [Hyaloraphidium curvatum]|nr:hypothetical protein DFJ74DRAFT_654528 [Hyaloraphidium curvatum]
MSSNNAVEADRRAAHQVQAVAQSMADGKLPTTGQATAAIQKLEDSGFLRDASRDMSADGRALVRNAEKILDTSKRLLQEKSPDDQLQKLVFYSSRAGQTIAAAAERTDLPVDVREIKGVLEQLRKGVDQGARLARLLVTSAEFRQLLGEAWDLVKDTLKTQGGDATRSAVEAIEQGKPQEAYSAVTQKAGEVKDVLMAADLSHGQKLDLAVGKAQEAAGEVSARIPQPVKDSSAEVANKVAPEVAGYSDRSGFGEKFVVGHPAAYDEKPGYGAGLATVGHPLAQPAEGTAIGQRGAASAVTESAKRAADEAGKAAQGHQSAGQALDKIEAAAKDGAGAAAGVVPQGIKDIASKIGTEQGRSELAGRASDAAGSASAYIGDFHIPQDKIDALADRFQALITDGFGSRDDFKRGLEDLMAVVSDAYGRTTILQEQITSSAAGEWTLQANKDASIALQAAKELVENFAGGQSMDPLISSTNQTLTELYNDPEVSKLLADTGSLIHESLSANLRAEEIRSRASALVSRARGDLLPKYSPKLNDLSSAYSSFLSALFLERDDTAAELAEDFRALFRGAALDASGKPAFKPDLARDLAGLLPKLARSLAYVPVPRMLYEDEEYSAVFDNIVVKCDDIVPTYMRVRTNTLVDFKRPKDKQVVSVIEITMSRIRASAKDIAFAFRKQKGLVKMSDVGLVDFTVKGKDGLTIRIELEPAVGDASEPIRIRSCEAEVDALDFVLHETQHDTLYKILKPFIHPVVKSQVQAGIADAASAFIRSSAKKLAGAAAGKAPTMGTAAAGGTSTEMQGKIGGEVPEYASKAYDVTAPGA